MIDLNAFYHENKWLILCLCFAILFIALYAFLRTVKLYPGWLDDDNDGGTKPLFTGPTNSPARKNITHDDDHFVQLMTNEKWAIIANIRDSVSMDQLKVIANQIINFHNYYSLLVDKTTIDTHTENIYDFHSAKTEEIKKARLQKTGS